MLLPLNDHEVLQELDRRMAGYGNGARLARELHVEPAHLRSMKSGSKRVSQQAAAGLGFELRWVRTSAGKGDGGNDGKQ